MGSKTGNPGDVIGCDLAPDLQLNLNVRGMPPSATLAINDRSDQLARQGTTVGAICRHIVQVHNGKIEVESEVGKGSTFRIIIPLRCSGLQDNIQPASNRNNSS